ncbi:hypothetical protein BY996DRAFT_6412082 [Phakopsora pachyrhizi]|nr:hypothetical protein BY996DRAFT_6412082 [Phakopsora pachyrhizi]
MPEHEAFFSFSVPPNDSKSTTEPYSIGKDFKPIAAKHDQAPNKTQLSFTACNFEKSDGCQSPSGLASPCEFSYPLKTFKSSDFNAFKATPAYEIKSSTAGESSSDDKSPVVIEDEVTTSVNRSNSRQQLFIKASGFTNISGQSCRTDESPSTQSSTPGSAIETCPTESRPNAAIGLHNTRPMTAPGAAWTGGQYNHGYDYSSASFGLFRGIEEHGSVRKSSLTHLPNSSTSTSADTSPVIAISNDLSQTTHSVAPSESPSLVLSKSNRNSFSSEVAGATGPRASNFAPQFSTPDRQNGVVQTNSQGDLHSSQSPTLGKIHPTPHNSQPHCGAYLESPFPHPNRVTNTFQPPISRRPSTHAGTSSTFGEHPDHSYGPLTPISNSPVSPYPPTLSSFPSNTCSRPVTANISTNLSSYDDGLGSSRPSTGYDSSQILTPFSTGSAYFPGGGDSMRNSDLLSRSSSHPGVFQIQPQRVSTSGDRPHPYGAMYGHGMGLGTIESTRKLYQLNSHPGAPRKRARRRYDEIERLYSCSYPGCTKAYGTLNHLNAHIIMQKHGPKRLPQEFKEIRKEWRARKKAEAEARSWPYKQPISNLAATSARSSQVFNPQSYKGSQNGTLIDQARFNSPSNSKPTLLGFTLGNTSSSNQYMNLNNFLLGQAQGYSENNHTNYSGNLVPESKETSNNLG